MTNQIVPSGSHIDREKIELIKRTIAKGSTDDEFALFVQQVQRTGLDPFSRQIYMRKSWDSREQREVMSIGIGIDGARLIAERTGRYQGQLGPWWCGEDGEWRDVWLKKDAPLAAKVGVVCSTFREPLYAVARYDAYVQNKKDGTPNAVWLKMPDLMLAKCAESLALRKAFPMELSGLYTSEEMGQADNPVITVAQPAPALPFDDPDPVVLPDITLDEARAMRTAKGSELGTLNREQLLLIVDKTPAAVPLAPGCACLHRCAGRTSTRSAPLIICPGLLVP